MCERLTRERIRDVRAFVLTKPVPRPVALNDPSSVRTQYLTISVEPGGSGDDVTRRTREYCPNRRGVVESQKHDGPGQLGHHSS